MQASHADMQRAPGLPITGKNEEFFYFLEPQDTGFSERRPQLVGRRKQSPDPFERSALPAVLSVVFVSLVIVYLLAGCFWQLNLRYGRGSASRGLAAGGREEGVSCDGDSDEEGQEATGDPEGQQGPSRDDRTRPVQQGFLPSHFVDTSRGVGTARRDGIPATTPTQQPRKTNQRDEWGLRKMPRRETEVARHLLSQMVLTAKKCKELFPNLSLLNGIKLVKLLSALAAIDLSAFSIVPNELESARQAAAHEFINLVKDTLTATRGMPGTELKKNRRHIEILVRVLKNLKKPRPIDRPITASSYKIKIISQITLFSAANMHINEALRRLSLVTTEGLTEEEVLQELEVISTLMKTRRMQIMRDGFLAWWLLNSQDIEKVWPVTGSKFSRQVSAGSRFSSLKETADEIHLRVAAVRGREAPHRGVRADQGEPWTQQRRESRQPSQPGTSGEDDVPRQPRASSEEVPPRLSSSEARGADFHGPGTSDEAARGYQEEARDGDFKKDVSQPAGVRTSRRKEKKDRDVQRPVPVPQSVFNSLSRLESALNLLRQLIPRLGVVDGLRLARQVTSLAALELGALSAFPRIIEERRHLTTRGFALFIDELLERNPRHPGTESTYTAFEQMLQILLQLEREAPPVPNANYWRYQKWMDAQATSCNVSVQHLHALLESMLGDDTGEPVSNAFLRRQLNHLETLLQMRTAQILNNGTSSYWLVKVQGKTGLWVLFPREHFLTVTANNQTEVSPAESLEVMDTMMSRATGIQVLASHALPPTQQQDQRSATAGAPAVSSQSPAGPVTPAFQVQETRHLRMPPASQQPESSIEKQPQRRPFQPVSRPAVPQQFGFAEQRGPQRPRRPPRFSWQHHRHYTRDTQQSSSMPAVSSPPQLLGEAQQTSQSPHETGSLGQAQASSGPQGQETSTYEGAVGLERHPSAQASDGDDDESLDPLLSRLLDKGLHWQDIPDDGEDD